MSQTLTATRPSAWFGQPPGLSVLFLTEMWEVFSFTGMRTLLIYYMVQQLSFSQHHASLIYGGYTGFVYLTPIVGGLFADRLLGRRWAVIIGGSIMAAGHFMMTFQPLFLWALGTVAIGNGLFLPSLPSQIGDLYPLDDPRRASAYTVYYVGKNVGAFGAPLVCGTLGEVFGWHWGFAAAGIGMVVGVLIYALNGRHLPAEPSRRAIRPAAPEARAVDGLFERYALLAGVALAVVGFRAAYEQGGNTLALWIGRDVERAVAGSWTIPMTWFQSFNPLLIFLMAPLLIAHWTRRARRGREASPVMKMSLGAMLLALAYLLLSAVAAGSGGHPSWLWLALFFSVMTAGELYILPIGLGLFGRLAPPALAATTIAIWYLTSFAGNLLAGVLGTFWSTLTPAQFFAMIASVSATAAVLLLALVRPATALERGVQADEAAPSDAPPAASVASARR